jgi:hypothetical protein
MAILMALAMMLPANLATYALDFDDAGSQEQQTEDVQQPETPEASEDIQQPEALEDAQAPEEQQDSQQPEESAILVPLDDPDSTEPYEPPAGEGTEDSPYLIASVADLQWMRTQIGAQETTAEFRVAHYKLTADIDMTGVENWAPIMGPSTTYPFAGTFDGDGHAISNLSVAQTTGGVGFFGTINGATIKDLALMNVNIIHANSLQNTGGIAAGAAGVSTISGCYVSGNITSRGSAVGGILGATTAGTVTIENCRVDGAVSGSYNTGGILGRHYGAAAPTIRNSLVTATVEGTGTDGNIGGILGIRDSATGAAIIENCRVLSQSVSAQNSTRIGVIYGGGTGAGTLTITDVSAWKGLKLGGIPLKEVLYGDALFSNDRNGATILSWKLVSQDGWPASLATGAWSYEGGKIPVLTKFAGRMSSSFPAYMSGYLTLPSGTADRAVLTAAIQTAEALQFSQYPDGWDDFQISFERVRIVLGDAESSQAELDAAAEALEDAVSLLKSRNTLELTGNGTEAQPYLIASSDLLQKVNRLINSADASVRNAYRDKYYKLIVDIDMTDKTWVPLGGSAAATAFTGVFDGGNHRISNLSMSTATTSLGFFGYISGATIKDLSLEDCDIKSTTSSAAILAGISDGGSTVTNCQVSGTVSGTSILGGIVGWVYDGITVKDCSVNGTITSVVVGSSGLGQIGGVIGRLQGAAGATIIVENCTVAADITAEGSSAAGIVGYAMANNTVAIKNCDISLSADGGITAKDQVAGIIYSAPNSLTVTNCTVIGGTLKATSETTASRVGGIVGDVPYQTKVQLTDCYVRTDIEAANTYVGGLVGSISSSATSVNATGCAFSGSITGASSIGGLVGEGTKLTVTDCYVDGTIAGTGQRVGGIIGYKSSGSDVSIRDSYVLASLSGREKVGGILGEQPINDAGRFSVEGFRFLGESIIRDSFSSLTTLGALSGDARYHTAYYTLTDAFSWIDMMLNRKTLETTTVGDPFFSPERNGQGFLSWALRSETGWPAKLTSNTGAWSYSAGKLPVLKKFQEIMSNDFPEYMADLPDSGTPGDKTGLVSAIEAAEALDSAAYVEEGAMWAEVQKKLSFARQIDSLYDASQIAIDAAKTDLTDAIAELDRLNNITFVGDGTEASPYEIPDLDRLLKMDRVVNSTDVSVRDGYRNKYYKLTANIDLDGVPWVPLGGTSATAFTGAFDGNGKAISNLNLSGTTVLGFFGYVSGTAVVKNLTLKDFSIEGTGTLGAIAASSASAATIADCAVSGTIIVQGNYAGGITSSLTGTISSCTAEVDIFAHGNGIGGIVGQFASGTIENCSVRGYGVGGAITNKGTSSTSGTGGIAGNINSAQNVATIENCSTEINIMGANAGGIVGYGASSGTNADRIVISGCYFDGMLAPATASATASATANLGGIAGAITNNFRITDCRSDGTITMAGVAGGILGRYSGTTARDVVITNCYTTMRIGNGTTAGGIVGNNGVTNNNGKLVVTDSLALNEQVGGETAAEAIHAFGEDNTKFDYTNFNAWAWNGMLIRVAGETQAAPSDAGAVSYSDLQTTAGWPSAFQSSPWVFQAGKLPVLAGMSGMSGDFPAWMANPGARQDITDARELLILVSSTDTLVQATWTAESWGKLTEALGAARVLLRTDRTTQSAIDAAAEALQAAIDGLEPYKEITTLEGEGTKESPFLIGSAADYEEMGRLLDISDFYRAAYYKLVNDIDLKSDSPRSPMPYTTATSPNGAPAFTGDFDGGGFTISNLTVNHTWATGMFGYVNGARIHDLSLKDCDISGGSWTGAIAGRGGATFENIYVTGTVAGSSSLGGIVGLGSGTMKNCHFEGTVETKSGPAYWVGGLCGQFNSSIEDCSFKGELLYKGVSQLEVLMGGIVGAFSGGDITGCYVEANIIYEYHTGDSYANPGGNLAGIVGRFDGENIIDCHFKGKIDDRGENIAGIVGIFYGYSIRDCTSEGDLTMNFPSDGAEGHPRPAGGIVGRIETGSGNGARDVIIDNVTSSMGIGGFREAGGIGGVVAGGGSLVISNSYALNTYLNNSGSDFYVDPFFFGADWYAAFTGTYTSENNYIWDGMMINGKTLEEWKRATMSNIGDDPGDGITIGPRPGGGGGGPGDGGNPGQPGDGGGGPGIPGDGGGGGNPGGDPSGPSGPSGPGLPSLPGDGSLSLGAVSADASGTGTGVVIDNRPPAVIQIPPSAPETVVEQPDTDTPRSGGTTGTEVSLTPIPLGLGFQTVANTVLTIAVGFVALGIFALGGFVSWRMYRRRIDVK